MKDKVYWVIRIKNTGLYWTGWYLGWQENIEFAKWYKYKWYARHCAYILLDPKETEIIPVKRDTIIVE